MIKSPKMIKELGSSGPQENVGNGKDGPKAQWKRPMIPSVETFWRGSVERPSEPHSAISKALVFE